MKDHAMEASEKVRSNFMDVLSLVFYTTVMYSMKLVEFVIAVTIEFYCYCILMRYIASSKGFSFPQDSRAKGEGNP